MSTVVAVSRNEAYAFSKPVREQIILVAGIGVEGDAHAGTTVKHRGRVRADPTQPNLRQVHLLPAELFEEVREEGYDVGPGQLGENVTTRGIVLRRLPRGTILRFGPAPADAAPTAGGAGPRSYDPARHAEDQATTADGSAPHAGDHASTVGGAAPSGYDPSAQAGDHASTADGAAALAGLFAAAHEATLSAETEAAVAAVTAAAARDGHSRPDARPAVIVAGLRNPCVQINGFRPGLLKRVIGRDDAGDPVPRAGVMAVVLRGGPVRPGDPIAVDLPPQPHLPLERV